MLSQTVEYALRAMSRLALLAGAHATGDDIARATGVPRGYLSKVMRDLVRAGLVKSFRGLHGGFALARTPESISILDIVNAVAALRRIECCPLDNPLELNLCPLHRCLDDVRSHFERRFECTTLASVLEHASSPASQTELARSVRSVPTSRPPDA